MSIFRSERMVFCHLILHQDYAFDCLVELGYEGKVHFVHIFDAEHPLNHKFQLEINRCIEMERIIRILQDELNRVGLETVYYPDADQEKPKESDLIEIEKILQNLYTELIEVQSHCDALQQRRFSIYENREVIQKMEYFLTGDRNTEAQITSYESMMTNLIRDSGGSNEAEEAAAAAAAASGQLLMITGSIPVEKFSAFELVIWRLSRGSAAYVKHEAFEIPEDIAARANQKSYKYAFIIVFVGEQLNQKLLKICQGFQVRIYSCPNLSSERLRQIKQLTEELENLKKIFEKSCEHKRRILYVARADLYLWRAKLHKMQQVYYALNRFNIVHESKKQYNKYLQANCWIPKPYVKRVRLALLRGSRAAATDNGAMFFPPILIERHHHPPDLKQPTYFRTNKFTRGFQNMIDAYGLATYRELNPAPYTIVTFPFLFAVMFGDIGHGMIMFLFAYALIWREEKIKRKQREAKKPSEIFDLLFAGRYIIMMMGIFSIYTGFIYNDMLSKPLNIFGSSWRANFTEHEVFERGKFVQLNPANPAHYRGSPYIFGIDPVWNSLADNAIILANSLKMKFAIILGILQMIFGLCLSAWNDLYFRSNIDFLLVFIPQIIFFGCLFFYLLVLIFHKWIQYGGHQTGEHSAACGPSILITFINMILMKKSEKPPEGCKSTMYTGQIELQYVLLCIAFITVPILLCGKPIHFMYQHRRIKSISDPEHQAEIRRSTLNSLRKSLIYNVEFAESASVVQNYGQEEKLSEIWIHQGIHTIECVLGSVSHTASYLRLWALSLAHSQLSHVIWKMVLSTGGLQSNYGYLNAVMLFFTFFFFAILTVAILVIMEGLSAFLHTLRLHWVEFQSKFYGGLGEPFIPFYFKKSKKRDSYV